MSPAARILCAEDDADIRLVLDFSLRHVGGFDLMLCDSGDAALAAAPAFGPDLVLLDVMMPVRSGPQTLAALRELPGLAQVPVVFLTAKAMPDELEGLLAHGATGVIVKPFDPNRLPQDLSIFIDYGRARRVCEPPPSAAYVALRERFCTGLPQRWAEIAQARGDTLRQALHRLAGAAGSYGCHALQQRASEAECLAAQPAAADTDALAADLADALRRVEQELQRCALVGEPAGSGPAPTSPTDDTFR